MNDEASGIVSWELSVYSGHALQNSHRSGWGRICLGTRGATRLGRLTLCFRGERLSVAGLSVIVESRLSSLSRGGK